VFCKNCGKELQQGAKFCAGCGTPVPAEEVKEEVNTVPAAEPAAEAAEPAAKGESTAREPAAAEPVNVPAVAGKKPGKGILIGAVAAVAVVALVVILVVSGVFSSPKAKVGAALLKTKEAYSAAAEKAKLPDCAELIESRKYSQKMGVTITEVGNLNLGYGDLSVLEGFGLRASVDTNIPGKEAMMALTGAYGATDLVTGQVTLQDSKIYLTSAQILGDKSYGVDTATLGADLEKVGVVDDYGYGNQIGFNIFELIRIAEEGIQPSEEAKDAADKVTAALVEAITVEKGEKTTVDVNGAAVECAAYQVVIPQDALEDCLDVVMDIAGETDYEELMLQLLMACGIPEDDAEELVYEMYLDDSGLDEVEMAMEEALDILGDIELAVYLDGGYVMAVEYDNRIEGVRVKAGAYMGGGKNYVDDFSLVFEGKADGSEISMELISTGDHAASGGTFTDETTLEVREDKEKLAEVVSELSYAPKAKENNFSWKLDCDGLMEIEANGQLNVSGHEVRMNLEELELKAEGTKIGTVALDYELTNYAGGVKIKDPVMLSTFDEDSIMDLGEDIADNVEDWGDSLYDFLEDEFSEETLNELIWMLQYMFW